MRKKIILLGIGLLLIIAVIIFVTNNQPSDIDPEEQPEDMSYTSITTDISGIKEVLPFLGDIKEETIQDSLKGIIRMNVVDPKESYKANYRNASYTSTIVGEGYSKRFIVDIPELERSFVVQIDNTGPGGSTTLYSLCPQANELLYKQQCTDTP